MRNIKIILFLVFILCITVLCWNGTYYAGGDFITRYRMGVMIRYGVNPVDYVNNKEKVRAEVELPESLIPPDYVPTNLDFPWTQSIFALFSLLSQDFSLAVFRFLQWCCLVFSMVASFHYLVKKIHVERLLAAMLVSLFYFTSYARTDIKVGNTGLLAMAGVFFLFYGWDNKKVWLEAIGMTLLCMKPQTGLLFVILLLLERHFYTLILTGVFCFLLSVPEMIYLHRIPWDFLRTMFSIKYYFSGEPQISGLFCVFCQTIPQNLLMACNLITSIAILCVYWWRYPVKDPMVRMLPAVIGSLFCSYSRTYHFIFLVVPLLCLTGLLKDYVDNRKETCIVILLMVLLWVPLQQYLPPFVFLMKYLIAIFSVFYIGNHYKTNSAQTQ